MATSSGRPDNLRLYGLAAIDQSDRLTTPGAELGVALDSFRASGGWSDWLSDVPPLDIDVATSRTRLAALGRFTRDVGDGFRAADSSGEVVTADHTDLIDAGAARMADPGGTQGLVQDGDRWILDAGTGPPGASGAHVRVFYVFGVPMARVSWVMPDGSVVEGPFTVLTPDQMGSLVIRTSEGNDYIELPANARVGITVWARDGNDFVGGSGDLGGSNPSIGVGGGGDDLIFGGDGDDVLLGGAGNDRIYGGDGSDSIDGQDGDDLAVGGDGFDVIYGGRGQDTLLGGRGDDYLEGGSGDDRLLGGAGNDVLSGGRGDDRLFGGDGDDTMFGGQGDDRYWGGQGDDTATVEAGESRFGTEATVTIELTGEPGSYAILTPQPDWMSDAEYDAWLERIDSDLELIRTTPSGREGLEALDAAAHDSDSRFNPFDSDRQIIVVPYGTEADLAQIDVDRDGTDDRDYQVRDWINGRGLPGNFASPPGGADGHHATVSAGGHHNVAADPRPPVVSLFHELAHSFDQLRGGTPSGTYTEELVDASGTVIDSSSPPRAELNSVGFDLDGDGDVDTVPSGDGSHHPEALTENSLRDDIGWDPREGYVYDPGRGQSVEVSDP